MSVSSADTENLCERCQEREYSHKKICYDLKTHHNAIFCHQLCNECFQEIKRNYKGCSICKDSFKRANILNNLPPL